MNYRTSLLKRKKKKQDTIFRMGVTFHKFFQNGFLAGYKFESRNIYHVSIQLPFYDKYKLSFSDKINYTMDSLLSSSAKAISSSSFPSYRTTHFPNINSSMEDVLYQFRNFIKLRIIGKTSFLYL